MVPVSTAVIVVLFLCPLPDLRSARRSSTLGLSINSKRSCSSTSLIRNEEHLGQLDNDAGFLGEVLSSLEEQI